MNLNVAEVATVGERVIQEVEKAVVGKRALLEKIIREKRLTARALFGFWPANQVDGDDIQLRDEQGAPLARLHHLRQQNIKPDGKPNLSLGSRQ